MGYLSHLLSQQDLHTLFAGPGDQEFDDILGALVAEQLAVLLFVVGNRPRLDQGDEILRGEPREDGRDERGIRRDIVGRSGVEVGEVAAAASGNQDLRGRFGVLLQDEDFPAPRGGFTGAHQARRAAPKDDDVIGFHAPKIMEPSPSAYLLILLPPQPDLPYQGEGKASLS